MFVIHTRWHEDDLIGRLAAGTEYRYINLPAIAEADDPLGRAPGEYLWPDRRDLTENIDGSRAANAFTFAAMYQGRLRPRGGTACSASRTISTPPRRLIGEGWRIDPGCRPRPRRSVRQQTTAPRSSWRSREPARRRSGTSCTSIAKQVPIPQFVNDLLGLQQRFGETAINIESVGAFKAIPQMLRAIKPGIRVHEITPIGDKFMRAQPLASAWNAGRVLVPNDSPPRLGPFLDELSKFTGVHDAADEQAGRAGARLGTSGAAADVDRGKAGGQLPGVAAENSFVWKLRGRSGGERMVSLRWTPLDIEIAPFRAHTVHLSNVRRVSKRGDFGAGGVRHGQDEADGHGPEGSQRSDRGTRSQTSKATVRTSGRQGDRLAERGPAEQGR